MRLQIYPFEKSVKLWVCQWSKTTVDQTRENQCMQLRTYCRSRFVIQFRKQFVFNIDIAGFEPRHTQKTHNKNEKRDDSRDSDDRFRDLPEWLKEFADNLEDAEIPVPAHISQDSDSRRPMKAATNQGSMVLILTSQKNKIAKSACGPR